MRTISTRLTRKQAERLESACFWVGITPYKLAQNLLMNWLRDWETHHLSMSRRCPALCRDSGKTVRRSRKLGRRLSPRPYYKKANLPALVFS